MIGIIFVLHGRKNKLSVANFSGIEAATKHLTLPYEIGLLEGEHQTLEMAIQSLLSRQVSEIIFLPQMRIYRSVPKKRLISRCPIKSCLLWEQRMQLRNSYCSK